MIIPVNDAVLIKFIDPANKSKGGVALVHKKNKPGVPHKGQVVSVGPGKKNEKEVFIPTSLIPGTYVIFERYTGDRHYIDSRLHFLMYEKDVLATVDVEKIEDLDLIETSGIPVLERVGV